MKILLINPPNTHRAGDDFYVTFPLGLGYLAAYLEQHGHSVSVLDSLAGYEELAPLDNGMFHVGMHNDEIVAQARAARPDVIGISCSYTVQYPACHSLAQALKRELSVPLLLGGAHGSALPAEVLADRVFDYVVIGEGEAPTLELLSRLERGQDPEGIPGLAYLDDGQVRMVEKRPFKDVDIVPFPARHLFDMNQYIYSDHSHNGETRRKPYATMITSRGCPLDCVFCSVHTIWGRNNRTRSVSSAVDEIEHLYNQYGIREIHFEDDMLTLNRERTIGMCRDIVDRGLDIAWTTPNGIYVNTLTRPVLEAMKASGCYQLALAIESGNDYVLRTLMKKRVALDYARQIVQWMRELELGVYFFFIVGMPGETREHVLDTIAYAKELAHDEAYFSIATPYPGTELYTICKERGYIPKDLDLTLLRPTQPVIETEHLSRDDIRELTDFAYEEFEAAKRAAGGPTSSRMSTGLTMRIQKPAAPPA